MSLAIISGGNKRPRVSMDNNNDNNDGNRRSATSATQAAINEIGEGVPVVNPPSVPLSYMNHFTIKLPYNDIKNGPITSSSVYQQIYRPFSIFDPDYTGIGSQPYQRDTWAALYAYYTVIKCHYEIIVANESSEAYNVNGTGVAGSNGRFLLATLRKSTNVADLATSTNTKLLYEQKYNINKIVPPGKYVTFSGTLTQGDFQLSNLDADNDKTWTAVGSDPTVNRLLGLNVTRLFPLGGNADDGILTGTVVNLIMEVQFNDFSNRATTS